MDEKLYYSNGPSEWEYRQLGDVVTFQGGSQPPKKYFSNEKLDGMIRLIQIRDYKSNSFKTYVPKELCRRFCNSDDIMIGRYGPPIFQILRGIDGAYNVALIKAIPNEEVLNKEYLYYFIKNEHLFKLIDGLSQRTSGQTGIDMEVLKKYIIPIPSKDEQEKIASILSTVDEQIDNVDALIEKNKELKKGLMQTLLIKGIGHTKFKKTEIGEIPEEWEVGTLSSIIDKNRKITYGIVQPGEYVECGKYVIRAKDYSFGWVRVEEIFKCDGLVEKSYARARVKEGDVLLTIVGSVGNLAIVPSVLNEANITQQTARLSFDKNKVNNVFYYNYLKSDRAIKEINKYMKSGVQPSLNLSDVEKFKIVIPSIEEQERISLILSSVDEKVEQYENKKQKLEELKKGLMQQLLTGMIRVTV
nr:restriction endonuclease subunit S [uncultured Clostridium sp.]